MAHDMLVKLYEVKRDEALFNRLREEGVTIKRVMAADLKPVLDFVKAQFSEGWMGECQYSIFQNACFIAVKDGAVVGFACYDSTAKGFFGPTGVLESLRGLGIGKALLIETLLAMWAAGYGYAIIGWVGEATGFYAKSVGATIIPDSFPGVYKEMIRHQS